MLTLGLLTRIAVSFLVGLVFGALWGLVNRPRRIWVIIAVAVIAGIIAFGGTFGLRLIPSRPVAVTVEPVPPGYQVDGVTVVVSGTVSPPDTRVMVLVHPWDSDRWWVQETPWTKRIGVQSNHAEWQTVVRLGDETHGHGQAFEVIAVGSQDSLVLDILAERYFRPGTELFSLPTLSHSNSVVLIRK